MNGGNNLKEGCDVTYADICQAVRFLKKRYGEQDPFRLCEAMGILLLQQPMGTHETAIKGFFMRCKRISSITVNSDLPEVIQRIIVAHELGHAVIHRHGGIHAFHEVMLFDQTEGLEREANLFAAELLLEDGTVLEAFRQELNFFDAAAQFAVPAQILDFKLRLMKQKGYDLAEIPIQSTGSFIRKMDIPYSADFYG
jgi:Zn-dependent peptidase ImmA (M78 family)